MNKPYQPPDCRKTFIFVAAAGSRLTGIPRANQIHTSDTGLSPTRNAGSPRSGDPPIFNESFRQLRQRSGGSCVLRAVPKTIGSREQPTEWDLEHAEARHLRPKADCKRQSSYSILGLLSLCRRLTICRQCDISSIMDLILESEG